MKGATTIVALVGLIAAVGGASVGSVPLPTGQHGAAPATAASNVTLGDNAEAGAVAVGIGGSSVELSATGGLSTVNSSPIASPSSSASRATSASSSMTGDVYAATAPASTESTIGLFAYDLGGAASSRSSAGWEAAARNDSILIGEARVYAPWISQLHAWNPNLTIQVYNLGPYLQKGSSDFTTIEQQDPSWFAHDAKGNLINLHMFPDNYLMDMGNAGFRAWHAQQLAATVNEYGFDGALDDSVGTAALSTNYASGTPIDTVTGKPYTDAEYLANSVLMLNADKAALDGKYLAFNGLISGTEYESDTSILATSNADAGMSEHFLREPTTPMTSFPSTSALDDTLEMMSSMAAHGKAFLGFTKVWVSASSSQLAKWEQYVLAVYLLGKGSASYWDFMPSKDADNTVVSYSNMQDQLGAPLGAYTTNGSTLSRSFQYGSVSLNTSTDTASITVT